MPSKVASRDRLAAVMRSGLIGGEREAVFDELTSAAAALLDCPFAFMTAVDTSQSFWKSTFGITDGERANSVGDSFCQYVIESGSEVILGDVTQVALTADNPSIETMGIRAWAGCPVMLDGQILGTFCVVDERVREWSEHDRGVLRALTASASRELQLRSDLGDSRDATSKVSSLLDIVRSSLLPPTLPLIPGIEMAAWFRAADDGDLLLGDFYDVFPLPDDKWGFVIGDVCGHGAEAARLTALVRYTMRAAAIHHADPADALAEVDTALHADRIDVGRFATASFLTIDAKNAVVNVGRAGHTLPIVRSADGTVQLVSEACGPPLGAVPGAEFSSEAVRVKPGDTWVLYTDGVTESRHQVSDEQLGESGLIDIIKRAGSNATAHDLVECVRVALGNRSLTFTDDIAVLVIRHLEQADRF